jgi:hypothetical protein
VLAALGASALSANTGYGWIDSITNQTPYFVLFQSTDPGGNSGGAGHVNVVHVQSRRVRDDKGVNNMTLLGAPYFLAPKGMGTNLGAKFEYYGAALDTYTLDNFPVPWQGGGDGGGSLNLLIFLELSATGTLITTQFKIQEQAGGSDTDYVHIMSNNQDVSTVPRKGNTHYDLVIAPDPTGANNGVGVTLNKKN